MLELTLDLNENKKEPYYVQLYRFIREEIEIGRISAGTRLPSIRQLSEHLRVSRNTVEGAYLQLVSEGYVTSKPRSGLYVAELEERFSLMERGVYRAVEPQVGTSSPIRSASRESDIIYDFRSGAIDLRNFPEKVWSRISQQVMQDHAGHVSTYGDAQGELGLRSQLAKYLAESRGVHCLPEQVVIGAGTQQLLALLCQLLGSERPHVAVEDPGYNGAKSVFTQLHLQVTPVPLEEDGIHVECLKHSGARVVYVTPSHQFPLGMVLPIQKRLKLLQWAIDHDGIIIEDDYDSEFRYHGRPIPALQGLDHAGKVVYMGTFSKSFLSSIRVSYMVLPEQLLAVFQSCNTSLEPTASLLHSQTLERFMAEGWWEKHLRRMKTLYEKKHVRLLSAIHRELGACVKVIGQHAGLHIVLEVCDSGTEFELIRKAEARGVRVYGTSQYWASRKEQTPPRLLLGFGGLTEHELEEGIKLLGEAWFPQTK